MLPLFVLSLGRSGSTVLMQLLSSHPQVIANEAYPLEFRPLESAARQELLPGLADPRYRFDGWTETIGRPLELNGLLDIGDAFAAYAALAATAEKTPIYAVEKAGARHASLVADRLPGARFIALLRDPRDIILSARAFDLKRGYRGFLEQDGDDDVMVARKYAAALAILESSIEHLDPLVVRYEDLIRAPAHFLEAAYRALELDASSEIIMEALARMKALDDGRHRTSPPGTVERWREEMPSRLREACLEHLGSFIERYGYPAK